MAMQADGDGPRGDEPLGRSEPQPSYERGRDVPRPEYPPDVTERMGDYNPDAGYPGRGPYGGGRWVDPRFRSMTQRGPLRRVGDALRLALVRLRASRSRTPP